MSRKSPHQPGRRAARSAPVAWKKDRQRELLAVDGEKDVLLAGHQIPHVREQGEVVAG
ncbi:hypothetical protein ACIBBD_34875 [Streptomyces sp. NPDC051315]|uniref:hypothetical protein n=1 Tax=Streptomyces sp. NPDC051315 TaxID=3365650 RepID=UPI003789C805